MERIITITSGKGRTDKTTVTANLAAILAQSGEIVLAIDMDVRLHSLDILMVG